MHRIESGVFAVRPGDTEEDTVRLGREEPVAVRLGREEPVAVRLGREEPVAVRLGRLGEDRQSRRGAGRGWSSRVAGVALSLVAAVWALGSSLPGHAADAARGKLLYESRCSGCHDQSVHRREPLRAKTVDEVRGYVLRWNQDLKIGWKDSEVDDVTLYLNGAHYNYPCTDASCADRRAMLAPATRR